LRGVRNSTPYLIRKEYIMEELIKFEEKLEKGADFLKSIMNEDNKKDVISLLMILDTVQAYVNDASGVRRAPIFGDAYEN